MTTLAQSEQQQQQACGCSNMRVCVYEAAPSSAIVLHIIVLAMRPTGIALALHATSLSEACVSNKITPTLRDQFTDRQLSVYIYYVSL